MIRDKNTPFNEDNVERSDGMANSAKNVVAIRFIKTDDDPAWHLLALFRQLGYDTEPRCNVEQIGCGIYEKTMEVNAPEYVCQKVFGDLLRLQTDGAVTGVVTLYIKEGS